MHYALEALGKKHFALLCVHRGCGFAGNCSACMQEKCKKCTATHSRSCISHFHKRLSKNHQAPTLQFLWLSGHLVNRFQGGLSVVASACKEAFKLAPLPMNAQSSTLEPFHKLIADEVHRCTTASHITQQVAQASTLFLNQLPFALCLVWDRKLKPKLLGICSTTNPRERGKDFPLIFAPAFCKFQRSFFQTWPRQP